LQSLSTLACPDVWATSSQLAALSRLSGLRSLRLGLGVGTGARLYEHLELYWCWGLPLHALTLTFASLAPQHIELIGQCPHLTALRLISCSGCLGPVYSHARPYACLR
jgi:hypothetical protein